MSSLLPQYVVERLRRPVPQDGCVVPGSTAVVSFGNAAAAGIATVGLNPSRQEFLDRNGRELTGSSRRFETMKSLGVSELVTAPDSTLIRVVQACNDYFAANPYRQWFDQLEPILQSVGTSYYDSSACHLDLVQWATNPVWSRIPDQTVRERLLEQDVGFLCQQLRSRTYKLVLINGKGVVEQFEAAMGITLRSMGSVTGTSASSRLLIGNLPWGTRVIAWSINVQSSFGVCNALRDRLAACVAELARSSHLW